MNARGAMALSALVAGACQPAEEASALQRDCTLRVSFDPGPLGGTPTLRLQPSAGAPREVPMSRAGDAWEAAVRDLPPGPVQYHVEVAGQVFLDQGNPLSRQRPDGVEVSYAEIADCSAGAWALAGRVDRPDGVRFTLRLLRAATNATLDLASVEARLDGRTVQPALTWPDALTFDFEGLTAGKHHFTLTALDETGAPVERFEAPFWSAPGEAFRWEDALVYQIVVDRFAAERPFTDEARARPLGRRIGGTLNGVRRVLEEGYFEDLGVNVLWLSPLYDNPEDLRVGREGGEARYVGYHGYWPAADRAVEPAFGTESDLDALVAAAHARGLRVIMDAVLNHVDETHPLAREKPEWFRQPACICGEAACPWSTHIDSCWFTPYLPDVDWRAPGALDHQVENARWWMARFDLDGLRLDAVPMMPRLVTRQVVDVVGRRFEGLRERQMLLGETYTAADGHDLIRWSLGPDGLDSQFDFPVMWTLRETLASQALPLTSLAETITRSAAAWYGSSAVMAVMVGNHDVPRFTSAVAPADADPLRRLRLAQAAVHALPGMPILYYGDEIGLAGAYDPANRAPMRFAADWSPAERALQRETARLGRLRACQPSLRRGDLRLLGADEDTIAWVRGADDERPAVFVLNRADDPRTLTLALGPSPPRLVPAYGAAEVRDTARGRLEIELGPETAAVLVREGDPCVSD